MSATKPVAILLTALTAMAVMGAVLATSAQAAPAENTNGGNTAAESTAPGAEPVTLPLNRGW